MPYHTALHSTHPILPYAMLLHPILPRPAIILCVKLSTIPQPILFYSIVLYSTPLHSALLCSTLCCSNPPYSNPSITLRSALFYSLYCPLIWYSDLLITWEIECRPYGRKNNSFNFLKEHQTTLASIFLISRANLLFLKMSFKELVWTIASSSTTPRHPSTWNFHLPSMCLPEN